MGLVNAALNVAADCITGSAAWMSLHDADPGLTGANEIAGVARKATAWSPAGGSGDSTTGPHLFTGGPANGPVLYYGLWTTGPGVGGTFLGSALLVGDTQFNSAGEYTVLQAALDGGACP